MFPLPPLAELAAHEKQFFAGMSVHPGEEHPQIGELLPFIARHFRNERTFAVDDFIVTQNQDEALVKRVDERERDVAVMKPQINRIEAHVMEKVVHPSHVPFETETKSAQIGQLR